MRVAKFSRTLLLLALPAAPVACAWAQDHPNVQPSAVRDQLMKQGSGAPQPPSAAPVKSPAPPKSAAQAPAKANPPSKAVAPAAAPGKAPVNVAPQSATKPPAEKPAELRTSTARRDPFDALLNNPRTGGGPPENLPPGKAGLVVGTLRISGIVRGTGGMIAIVSNPQGRVYFLREGDKLYDGSVDRITLDAISFHEFSKDAFGRPIERQVTRRLYPSPGEMQ